jgi:hypothetical protein
MRVTIFDPSAGPVPTYNVAESLAHAPSGGVAKMWLLGGLLPLIPSGYGIQCLSLGHARLFELDATGGLATAIATAFIAAGAFLHFHWFWGLHSRLLQWSPLLKVAAALVMLGALGFAIYRQLIP